MYFVYTPITLYPIRRNKHKSALKERKRNICTLISINKSLEHCLQKVFLLRNNILYNKKFRHLHYKLKKAPWV